MAKYITERTSDKRKGISVRRKTGGSQLRGEEKMLREDDYEN